MGGNQTSRPSLVSVGCRSAFWSTLHQNLTLSCLLTALGNVKQSYGLIHSRLWLRRDVSWSTRNPFGTRVNTSNRKEVWEAEKHILAAGWPEGANLLGLRSQRERDPLRACTMSGHGCTPGLQPRLDQAYLVPLEPSLGVWGLLEVRSTAGTLKACESYTWGHSVDTGPTLFLISLSHTHSQHRHSAWLQQSELLSASQFMKRSNLDRIKLTWNLCLLCNPDTVQRCSVKKVFLNHYHF